MQKIEDIDTLIADTEKKLLEIDKQRSALQEEIAKLQQQKTLIAEQASPYTFQPKQSPTVTNQSCEKEKIALFRSLFTGREDVFAKRFESVKTGIRGYQPCCRNEWIPGICRKPKTKCNECENRDLLPLSDEIIKGHLMGTEPHMKSSRDFTIGVYPMLEDETCRFLAVDFDKESWTKDAAAFIETCNKNSVPAALERSRSGQGGHVWIFFSVPIKAVLARKLGTVLSTETMDHRPEIGLKSYDRLFPSQDTLPRGGFGNLIALPLQKKPRERGNTVFLNQNFNPYEDQWAFLSSIKKMLPHDVKTIVTAAMQRGDITGVKAVITEEDDILPWQQPPSRQMQDKPIQGPLPKEVQLVLGNQIYIEKAVLPAALRNRLIRIAAFQNPEFYKNQAMRLSTYGTPPIINRCEDFPKHIGLPRGCLDEVTQLLQTHKIQPHLVDERFPGVPIDCTFIGDLRPEQEPAAHEMLRHDYGILAATTAFGKTVVGIYLLAKRRVNTLILVHRRQLLDQWIVRLQNFLDIASENIGQIGSGKRTPSGIIDIAMIQSLSKKHVVDDIVGEYGHIIVDECHHISAPSFEVVARQSKARYVTGLSATVVRKDGHHPIIYMNCGPIRYKIDPRKQAASRPFTHKVITRRTAFNLPLTLAGTDSLKMHDLYNALSVDDNRNQIIVDDILQSLEENRSPLVLTERRDHLEKLVTLLSPHTKNILVFKGGMGKKQRQALEEKLQSIPDHEERIIVATGRYLGEGFDDARLDTLFLTLPISWKGTLAQYTGRLHRSHDMKQEVVIYDYADLNVPMLTKMYARRLHGYKTIGYEVNNQGVRGVV